jgi:Ran GTPase-activating protein (RanGAP) involved in mRNA processing and transport
MVSQLDLSSNELCGLDRGGRGTYTAEGITAIADALRVNVGLTKISLAGNKLGEEGTKAICEALKQNKILKELDLSGYVGYVGSNIGGAAGAKHVADMLGVNGGLTALDLSSNDLKDEGVSAVCEAIQSNKETKLTSLNMGKNRIGSVGAKSVAAMVAVTGALTSLNLSSNNLCSVTETGYIKASQVQGSSFNEGDKVVYQGKEMIVSKAKDRDGDIKMTNLPDISGLNALADAFRVNGSLTALDLSSNCLKDEGVSAVCKAIQSNKETKLTSLNFSDNGISPVGANAVAAMVAVTGAQTKIN